MPEFMEEEYGVVVVYIKNKIINDIEEGFIIANEYMMAAQLLY